MAETQLLLIFILVLSILLGLELISKIPSTLHTPLMSGSNAISGVTIVGAIATSTLAFDEISLLGMLALFFATINVVGGYMITQRMLLLFKKKS